MNPTGIERGKRVIVGGSSPRIHVLPKDILETGHIIGINQWPLFHSCEYWIGLDTGLNWERYGDTWLKDLQAVKFMRHPNTDTETFVPRDAADCWFKTTPEIPTIWDETLRWESSTALAAISLAIVMGAAEVVLYGVDFVGHNRADGTQYHRPDFWEQHKEPINKLLKEFQAYTKIYKLHPDSWLDCPLLSL